MAQLIIDVPDAEVPRIQAAYTALPGYLESGLLPIQFVKAELVGHIKSVVRVHEQKTAAQAAISSVTDVNPS